MSYDKHSSIARKITRAILFSLKRNWGKQYKSRVFGKNTISNKHLATQVIVKLKTVLVENDIFDIEADTYALYDNFANINVCIFYNPHSKQNLQDLYLELRGVIRHELEHITQIDYSIKNESEFDNNLFKKRHKLFGQTMQFNEWLNKENEIIKRADKESYIDYILHPAELDAFCKGFYTQARLSKQPVYKIINKYLDDCFELNRLTKEEADKCKFWLSTNTTSIYPHAKLLEVTT